MSSDDQVPDPVSSTRSAGCETTIIYGRYPRNRNCPRAESKISRSPKQSALGSRVDSDGTSTIYSSITRNSSPALHTRSCPNTSLLRSIMTSWRRCESHRSQRPGNPCPEEEPRRSGSTLRGIPDSAGRSLKPTTNDAPFVSTTSGSAIAYSDWRPRISDGTPTMAEMWSRMVSHSVRCITRRWTVGHWAWTQRMAVDTESSFPARCVVGVRLQRGYGSSAADWFGHRLVHLTDLIVGLLSGIAGRYFIRKEIHDPSSIRTLIISSSKACGPSRLNSRIPWCAATRRQERMRCLGCSKRDTRPFSRALSTSSARVSRKALLTFTAPNEEFRDTMRSTIFSQYV